MDEKLFDYMLSQPLMTESGFVNEACLNELSSVIKNSPKTHERLSGDTEWNTKRITRLKQVTGYFANWSVRQLPTCSFYFPPNLEKVIGYLHACLKTHFTMDTLNDGDYWEELSLCDISELCHNILMECELFLGWNTKECLKDDWLDLDALIHNICLSIRDERRHNDAFDKKFKEEHGESEEKQN